MRYSNIHTHSVFSDGKNTLEENARKAVELGFVSLGFSDHSESILGFDGALDSPKNKEYQKAVAEIKKEFEGQLEVFCGIEKDAITPIDFDAYDYVLGSAHYLKTAVDHHPFDDSFSIQLAFINNELKGNPMEYAKRYYDLIVQHAQKNPFQVQGHFDLVNKFGLFDGAGEPYETVALEALDEVLRIIPFIEVNTGAISRGYRTDPYPEHFLLKRILEQGGKLVINSDSHRAEHLDCHFAASCEMLKKMGFSSVWQLRTGGFSEVKLSET